MSTSNAAGDGANVLDYIQELQKQAEQQKLAGCGTTTGYYHPYPYYPSGGCPACGYCPTCGRGGYWGQWPTYPQITYTCHSSPNANEGISGQTNPTSQNAGATSMAPDQLERLREAFASTAQLKG